MADRLRKLLKSKVADLGLTELDLLAYAKRNPQKVLEELVGGASTFHSDVE